MIKQPMGHTKNGKAVYVDMQGSHAATHIVDTPGLADLVRELLAKIEPTEDSVYLDKDMGRIVGSSDLVLTNDGDVIVYAKRINRDSYTRFVRERAAEPTRLVTVVLHKDVDNNYELWSTWIGPAAPQFPGDQLETFDSRSFWRNHALVWGNQAIQPGTERAECPWD